MVEPGVNNDHAATLREAREGTEPDLDAGDKACELPGAHQITLDRCRDRRRIQDRNAEAFAHVLQARLKLGLAARPGLNELKLGYAIARARVLRLVDAIQEIMDVPERCSP